MIAALLTRKVLLGQLFYEMSSGKQNRGVHHKLMNKGQHKEVKKTKKYKEWKDKIKDKDK